MGGGREIDWGLVAAGGKLRPGPDALRIPDGRSPGGDTFYWDLPINFSGKVNWTDGKCYVFEDGEVVEIREG